jgi:hypothetical protein
MTENPIQSNNEKKPAADEGLGLFDLIWLAIKDIPELLRSLKFAVWIIIILALFTLAGTVLPQQKFAESPEQFRQQYTTMFHLTAQGGGSGLGPMFYRMVVVPLQLYRVFETPLYLVLMCLLAISAALCAWDRLIITQRLLGKVKPESNVNSVKNLPFNAEGVISKPVNDARAEVKKMLSGARYRIFESEAPEGTVWIFGRKNAFRYYALVAMHFAFVFILVGGIIRLDSVAGYGGAVSIAEGDSQPVAQELHGKEIADKNKAPYTPLSTDRIELVDYTNIYREKQFHAIDPDTGFPEGFVGMPSDYLSSLRIFKPGQDTDQTLKEKTIEVNSPLSFNGVMYYQSGVDAELSFMVQVAGSPSQQIGTTLNQPFEIPGLSFNALGLVTQADFVGGKWVSLDGTESDLPFTVRLLAYPMGQEDQPVLLGYVGIGRPLNVDGVLISLDSVKQYSILQYTHDPGVPLVGFGGLILAIGMTLGLYFPYRTVRIMLKPKKETTQFVVGGNSSEIPDRLVKK